MPTKFKVAGVDAVFIENATSSIDGFMSAADKAKLDGIPAGGGSNTLAEAYAEGTAAADQTMLIQAADGGAVIFKANAVTTGSLVKSQTNGSVDLLDITDNSTQMIKSAMTDGASAIALSVDTTTAWSNTTAKILRLLSDGIEKLAVLASGSLSVAANLVVTGAASATNTTGISLAPNVADGATSIATKLNNATVAATLGFKDLSVQQNSVEQWFVGYPAATTIPELRGAGDNIGMRNSNGSGVIAQGANDVYIYGANAANWHFLANTYLEPTADNTLDIGNNTNRVKGVFSNWYDAKRGANLASGATITPTSAIHHVTGTSTISTIATTNLPTSFSGQLVLIPDDIFSSDTAGNIALASTAVVSKALIMTYDATTAKWYPSY